MARLVRHVATAPVKVEPSDKPAFICACGLTKNFPFCDGAHKAARSEEPGTLHVYGDDRQSASSGPDDFKGCTCACRRERSACACCRQRTG
jgi:CDGSH-type Zn-finger protein